MGASARQAHVEGESLPGLHLGAGELSSKPWGLGE